VRRGRRGELALEGALADQALPAEHSLERERQDQRRGARRAGGAVPARPLHGARQRSRRARLDRAHLEQRLEVARQGLRTRVAALAVLLERAQEHDLEVARQPRGEPARPLGLARQDRMEHLGARPAHEGRPARDALVERRPERVHVRARVDRAPAGVHLLRRGIGRRAAEGAARGEAARVLKQRQAEVDQQCAVVGRDAHVRGLHVAVDHACAVGAVQGARELEPPARGARRGDARPLLAQDLVEAAALDVVHGQVAHAPFLARGVDRDDPRMAELLRWRASRSKRRPATAEPASSGRITLSASTRPRDSWRAR
jgi:hypothetical protein